MYALVEGYRCRYVGVLIYERAVSVKYAEGYGLQEVERLVTEGGLAGETLIHIPALALRSSKCDREMTHRMC